MQKADVSRLNLDTVITRVRNTAFGATRTAGRRKKIMTNGNDAICGNQTLEVKRQGDSDLVFTRPSEALTKREYFAAMAMQGLVTNSALEYLSHDEYTKDAVEIADFLIGALNETK